LAFAAITAAAVLAFPVAAMAAPGGGGAPDTPLLNTGGSPGGGTIVCTVAVPPAGGTVTCPGLVVTLPAGLTGLNLVLSTESGPACAVTPGVTLGLYSATTGAKYSGSFSPPATATYSDSSITAGETIVVYNPATGTWGPAPAGLISSATAGAGSITVTLTGDPTFAVEGACGAVPGATVAVTGEPFVGEGILAGVLVAAGLALMWLTWRRRSITTV
jgi:hypothetical protein